MPPLRPAEFDDKTVTFDMPEFTKLFSKCVDDMGLLGWRRGARNPTREVLPVWARALTAHVAAPSKPMKSRRFTFAPKVEDTAS